MTMNLDFFKKRATVRIFDDRPVGDDTLTAIIEAASHAPNTGNMQLYSVVATTTEEGRRRLAPLHFNQPAATGAPVLLTVCADIRRFAAWCDCRQAKTSLDNFGGYLSAITDAAIFAQQIVTIAEENGLGCCYLGTATYNISGFAEALGLPDGVFPLVGIAIGYPAEKEHPVSDRLPVEAVMHKERFHDYTPADIDRYYAHKESLPESEIFISENDKQTLAQVFAEVRYPESVNRSVADAALARMGIAQTKE